ncbi:hypothetical protein ACFQNJ_01355 [Hydrogenophaga bisanensis]|uniref:Inovirus Gp2 family protein n=1 Tax=Hydrogenophaga bisanensis TaxID=439611 RepID=A0ABW2R6R4_9BURK
MQTYVNLEADHHIEFSTKKRQKIITIHDCDLPASALSNAETIIDDIKSSNDLAFNEEQLLNNHLKIENKKLANHYHAINRCFHAYSQKYVYSPKVAVFYEACKKLNLDPEWMSFDRPLDICLPDGKTTYAHLFNEFIKIIRHMCKAGEFRRGLQRHERNVLRRKARAINWEKMLFEWKSRHLILSLTLSYKEVFRSEITLDNVQHHLKRLLNNRKSNTLLKGIEGYVWKIEEGEKTGLHIHILIAYSTTTSHDIYIADKIGEYWEAMITDGMGQYWNSNRSKIKQKQLGHGNGVGQINHHDTEKREALRKNLAYLMKSDQYLKQKNCTKTRVVAMSRIPEKPSAGRPRVREASAKHSHERTINNHIDHDLIKVDCTQSHQMDAS